MKLILASTSKYRAELLTRLALPFEQLSPEVDETPQTGEAPKALAVRLASAKAMAVASRISLTRFYWRAARHGYRNY